MPSGADPNSYEVPTQYQLLGETCGHGWAAHATLHEAAHATFAVHYGFDFTRVVITPRPAPPATEWMCFVELVPLWGQGRDDDAMDLVLAGSRAEEAMFGHSLPGALENDLRAWRIGTGHVEGLDPDWLRPQLDSARVRTAELVRQLMPQIRQVTAALIEQIPVVADGLYAGFVNPLELTADEVRRLVTGA